ncbi:hypothetical protein PIB30_065383 [Stylosanthes scabra]|uniref:Uncharacterized protein n=1 Tax=Stylosanthes scabra TaxID=79078 RepID=A0ABU6SMU5_9FABA|nr:hypothetical protein [Stylosanthes scabra]
MRLQLEDFFDDVLFLGVELCVCFIPWSRLKSLIWFSVAGVLVLSVRPILTLWSVGFVQVPGLAEFFYLHLSMSFLSEFFQILRLVHYYGLLEFPRPHGMKVYFWVEVRDLHGYFDESGDVSSETFMLSLFDSAQLVGVMDINGRGGKVVLE